MKIIPMLGLLLLLNHCVPVSTSGSTVSKILVLQNKNYEPYVGMVKLYPESSNEQVSIQNPVIPVNSGSLHLEFDLLEENYRYVNARYIHCNADWTPSSLPDIQYMPSYNELPVNQYSYSQNTRIPYVNYQVSLPAPKKSGNYLLVLYNGSDPNDVLISRRFLVYEQKTHINPRVLQSSVVSQRRTHHELIFNVQYEGIEQVNPLRDFKTVILQNHNWNTVVSGLQPTLIREDQKYLEFEHFTGENNFPGLKEFRYFDLRSIDFRGMNVAGIQKDTEHIRAFVGPDKPRSSQVYTQINQDINGHYFLQNTDPNSSPLQSEYIEVNFELISEPVQGQVYLVGHLTNWNNGQENRMQYDDETRSYKGKLLLRQGYYDYLYWVQSDVLPVSYLEGSHFQTSNEYELLFYYRNPFNNFDELIGYRKFQAEIN